MRIWSATSRGPRSTRWRLHWGPMSEPPTLPDLPEYLKRDPGLLDFVLVDICRAHLERGVPLPVDAVPLLCERFLAYSNALIEAATKSRGNPGKNSGRVVSALHGIGWKVEAAVAHVATLTKQDPETVERNYYRWMKRTKSRSNSVR